MGKKQNLNLLSNRPTIANYLVLGKDDKLFIDNCIKNGLKANPVLRVNGKNKSPLFSSFWSMQWSQLIEIKNLVSDGDILKVLNFIYVITEEEFSSLDVFNCFSCYKWITDEIETINKLEVQELSHTFSQKEKDAGIEDLARFGHYTSLNTLSGGDITKEKEILAMPYQDIFMKFCLNKANNDIERNLSK